MTLMLFTFIFLTGSLVKMADTILNKGVGLWDVLRILVLSLPEVISFTLPASALAAVAIAIGGFSQNNELRAMKAVGVNPVAIMIPLLVIALMMSLVALAFNDQVVTEGSYAQRRLVRSILFKNPTAIFEPNKFIREFDEYIFLVKGVNGRHLDQVIIYQPQENKPTRTIIAERGEVIISPSGDELTLMLYNGTIDESHESELYKLDFETYAMPPVQSQAGRSFSKKIKELKIYELLNNLAERKGDAKELLKYRTELHRKISFSFGSFIFVLIGLPVAILVRRGELVWSLGLSMSMVICYYTLYVWAGSVSNHGFLPPEIALWLPNILLAAVGTFLVKQAVIS